MARVLDAEESVKKLVESGDFVGALRRVIELTLSEEGESAFFDNETAHSSADFIVIAALKELGGEKGKEVAGMWEEARRQIRFWYA